MKTVNDITILKIGGSLITDKSSDFGSPQLNEIERICEEISICNKRLIIIHGAGSFGHPLAKKYNLKNTSNINGGFLTHESVKELNSLFVKQLNNKGSKAYSVNPLSNCISKNGRIVEMFLDNILIMVEEGIIPVLHGDVVMDENLKVSVISGDQITTFIAHKLKASRIGIGSFENGVLDTSGNTITTINTSNYQKVSEYIGPSESIDVTGGMLGKVKELLELSRQTNTTSYIFNGRVPNNIREFLNGNNIGTKIEK